MGRPAAGAPQDRGHTASATPLIVGAAQALALNPGTSRSGITITAARFLGFNRDAAARISFLMAIPVTGGAVVFKIGEAGQATASPTACSHR